MLMFVLCSYFVLLSRAVLSLGGLLQRLYDCIDIFWLLSTTTSILYGLKGNYLTFKVNLLPCYTPKLYYAKQKTKQLATCAQKPATVAVRVIIPKNRKPSRVAMNIRQKRQMVIAIAPVFPILDLFSKDSNFTRTKNLSI